MWVRSAYWVGRPKVGAEAALRNAVDKDLVPTLESLPGVIGARALWARRLENGALPIACQIIIEFPSMADLDRMLASPERAAMRAQVPALLEMFEGTVSHIDFEVA
jgi:hypothetical protein